MKSIFLGILVLVLSLLTCFGQKNKFEIFGTKIKPKEITGGHEFNDLGVKQTTDVISSLTDDTLTYLWRLGTLRLKVHDYTAGFQSLFDLSYSNSNEGYPILDEIDFAYYVNWGFTILESHYPTLKNQNNYKSFKETIQGSSLSLNEKRKYLLNYDDITLKNALINTKYFTNIQQVNDEFTKKVKQKFNITADIDLNKIGELVKNAGIDIDSTKVKAVYSYARDLNKNSDLHGYFISSSFDFRYIETINRIISKYHQSEIDTTQNEFNKYLMRYINAITITNKREREDYALNSAIFAFKFGGNYSLVKSDTNSLQTRLGGHVDVNKVGNLAASINYELEKSVHRTFENKFSKLWIIGFGTDDRLESLTFKK